MLSTLPDGKIEELVRLNVASPNHPYQISRSANDDRQIRPHSQCHLHCGRHCYSGLSAYGATKAALIGFTRSLAREVGPLGITVNAVAPGFTPTDMTHGLDDTQRQRVARRSALGRLPNAEDVANAVEFLMDDKAANITGTVLTVDAGNTA